MIDRENEMIDRENNKLFDKNREYYKNNPEAFNKIKIPNKPHLNIKIIPKNTEQYLTFSLGNHLSFIDSAQFLKGSLDELANNQNRDSLKYVREYFTNDEE